MDRPISRRSLLLAAAAAAAAAACGRTSERPRPTQAQPAPSAEELQVLIASAQLVAGRDQRVTVGVLRNDEPLPAGEPVQLAFGPNLANLGSGRPAEFHNRGIEDRPYYRTTHRFDHPGQWFLQASSGTQRGTAALEVIDAGSTQVALVGQRMVPVATPTTADARGVNPICTRQPPCPFHSVSLDEALRERRPVAAIFATPALCQSRVCGPVLETLIAEAPPFANRVRFVHVEVYKSLQTSFTEADLTPGMRAYHLTFEPVLYLAGADGVIRERLDGPYDRDECRAALSSL